MMRVNVITRHNVLNYGSVMQAFATESMLRDLGCQPAIVDYRRSEEELPNLVKRHSSGKSALHGLYRNTAWRLLYLAGEKRFREMREECLTLTPKCDESNIWETIPNADVYLTGSDQVWNMLGDGTIDDAFFWAGVEKNENRRIISYAASFGCETVVKGYERRIGEWLSRYDAVSVREDSGVSIVEGYGLIAQQVLDPTLLLSENVWRSMSSSAKVPSVPYALVYNLHPDSRMLGYVVDKTAKSGLEVVSVCPTFRRRVGKHIILPSLSEFLGLFANAHCVYTDSFHGSALCINLGVPFVAVLPNENAARNKSLLRLFGLEHRSWDAFEGNAWDDDIDWARVNLILDVERKRSVEWLSQALRGDAK